MLKTINFNEVEKEILLLHSITNIIDSIINHLTLKCVTTQSGKQQIWFKNYIEEDYFNIIMADLLSNNVSKAFNINKKLHYIELLKEICDAPNFNVESSVNELKTATLEFLNWLNTEIIIENMWFPSIEINCDFKILRKDLVLISGNTQKHSLLNLTIIAKKLQAIFKDNGYDIDETQSMFVIEDFDNWIHGDGEIFSCYASVLSKYLNDIRVGIHNYLYPEYKRAYRVLDIQNRRYEYIYPSTVTHPLVRNYYWDLMNKIKSGYIFEKFDILESLKNIY